MVLKQRFAEGRTQFIDIGNNFTIETRASAEWNSSLNGQIKDEDIHAIVRYQIGDNHLEEALYTDFLQWLYSDNGELFQTLNSRSYNSKEEKKSTAIGLDLNCSRRISMWRLFYT